MAKAKAGKSKAKQTKTFLKKGLLEGQIKSRHKARDFKQKVERRKMGRNRRVDSKHQAAEKEGDDDSEEEQDITKKAKNVDSDSEEDEELDLDQVLEGEGMEDDSEFEDDDLSGIESDADGPTTNEQHVADLKALAEKDPEFFKYLQENDAELLDFDGEKEESEDEDEEDEEAEEFDSEDDDDESEDEGSASKKGKGKEKAVKPNPVLTKELLKKWQKNILETRSIRALRKLLLAFRSAATAGSESVGERYEIQSPAVFNKLIVTTLKYTPVVLSQHVPYKEKDGKFKLSTTSKQYATVQRLLKSFFVSLQSLLDSVSSESGIPAMAVTESAKLVPWIVGNRKVVRSWVKLLLGLYSTGTDEVRVAAFLSLRKLAVAADHSLRESVIKGAYTNLLASSRSTSIYTLPSITLMKNSASELFLLPGKQEGEMAYQLTFGYIRMLAILLRKGVKEGSKDAFKSVYNWQFVHAVDFWSLVLSSSCEKDREAQYGESPLRQLLYPLIQVALGAIRLVPTSRYYPLRFHLIRSLLRIVQRTGTYIPLSTPLFEVLDSPDLSKRSKPSTLKPLDWEYYIRCPVSYLKTRVYADSLADEVVYLLTDYFGALATSIAFPELSLPAVVALKRHAKKTGQARLGSQIKVLVEKLESNAKWIEEKREKIEFAPNNRDKVNRFLQGEDSVKTPLGGWLKIQKRVREQKRETMEKAAQGDADDL